MAGVLDSLRMFEAAAALPEQVEAAAIAAMDIDHLPDHDEIENVVVLGMGTSGVVGDLLTTVAGPFMPVPIVVHKGYAIPNFIDQHTVVFAVSFSGDTEETVEAATEAALAGGRMIVVSGGGELARLAQEWDAPHVPVPAEIPAARAALGALGVPPLVLLESMGFFPGARSWIDAAVAQLRHRRDALVVEGNPAATLARRIGRTLPIVYGGGGIGGIAAHRWKTQINTNAKSPAFANVHPELCHSELGGWGQHGDVTRQVFRLVNLRHDFEHPQVGRRFDLTADLLLEVVGGIDEVRAEGDGTLAQVLDLMLFGDVVSLHLAADAGVDPGPVPILTELRQHLAAP